MSFSNDILKFNAKTAEQSYQIHQKITIDLFSECIRNTPVQDGRARSNWSVSYNVPFPGVRDRIDGEADTVNNMVSDVAEFDGITATNVYLTNNVPYILRLEYDSWSPQKPNGWVRTAIKNAKRI